jgi:hypothetical protein
MTTRLSSENVTSAIRATSPTIGLDRISCCRSGSALLTASIGPPAIDALTSTRRNTGKTVKRSVVDKIDLLESRWVKRRWREVKW